MEVSDAGEMALSHERQEEQQSGMLVLSRQGTQPVTTNSSVRLEVPFVHYKQTARVQEVEMPVDVTHVHVEKVEVQAPHEIPIIHPRELGVHQQTKRNNPSPVDLFTVQKYQLPRLQPKYYDVEVPIYVPRYVEVPVPSHFVAVNREPLPDALNLGPSIKSGVATAPVPADNQVYSLAQAPAGAAQQPSQSGVETGENNYALRPQFMVHTRGEESEGSAEPVYFFQSSVTAGSSTNSSSWCPRRPAFFLTPSQKQMSRGPSDGAAPLKRQGAPATPEAVQSDALNVHDVASTTGAICCRRIGRNSADQAVSSICSCSRAPAATVEAAAAREQQPQDGEQLHEGENLHEKGHPLVVEIVA